MNAVHETPECVNSSTGQEDSLSLLAQLVVMWAERGITSTSELAKRTKRSERQVRRAKTELRFLAKEPGSTSAADDRAKATGSSRLAAGERGPEGERAISPTEYPRRSGTAREAPSDLEGALARRSHDDRSLVSAMVTDDRSSMTETVTHDRPNPVIHDRSKRRARTRVDNNNINLFNITTTQTPELNPPKPPDSDFESFWLAFPPGRKRGKGKALLDFRRTVAGTRPDRQRATAAELIAAARAYAAVKPDPRYVPLPSTWLNQARWLDVPEADPVSAEEARHAETRRLMAFYAGEAVQ